LKAESPIEVTESGIVKLFNELWPWKALLPMRSEFGMANAWTLFIESLFSRMWVHPEWCAFHMCQATSIVQVYSKRRCCLRLSMWRFWRQIALARYVKTRWNSLSTNTCRSRRFGDQTYDTTLEGNGHSSATLMFVRMPWFWRP
jgi:hypothetical protein